MVRFALLLALVAPWGAAEDIKCNGFKELCGRRFDEVIYPTTHNSMSSKELNYFAPNQGPRMSKQLEDGVRGMLIDVHKDNGKLLFCHGPCALGQQGLVEGLVEIRTFLDTHPHEVLTFLMEVAGVTPEEIAGAFKDAGIDKYCFPYKLGDPWPTLGEMITANQRLVVLTDDKTGAVPWLLPMWEVMWDTNWNIKDAAQFDCKCNRGKTTHPLFNMNHFISNPLPLPKNAEIANRADFLYERASRCWHESGRVPNFISVDHYEIGGLFEAVNRLNGVGSGAEAFSSRRPVPEK